MKTYLLFLFLVPAIVVAQRKTIPGLPDFQLGTTTIAELQEWSAGKSIAITVSNSLEEDLFQDNATDSTRIIEWVPDSSATLQHTNRGPGVRLFVVNFWQTGDIQFRNLYMSFHDGKLYEVSGECNAPLRKALVAAYGQPETVLLTRKSTCKNNFGNTQSHNETTETNTWHTRKNMTTHLFRRVGFNGACEPMDQISFITHLEKTNEKLHTDRPSKE